MVFAGGPLGSGKQWYCTQIDVLCKRVTCHMFFLLPTPFNQQFDNEDFTWLALKRKGKGM